jgi:outer membrane immunogenic protein
MRRHLIASLTTVGLSVGLTVAAFAADLPRIDVPYSWTGFYVGASTGYGSSNRHVDATSSPISFDSGSIVGLPMMQSSAAAAAALDFNTRPKGFISGGQLGYNFQSGPFVWGVETDLSWANVKGSATQTGTAPFVPVPQFNADAVGTAEQKMNAFGTLRARMGLTPVDKLLVFGTGGLAYGHAEFNTNISEVLTPDIGIAFTNATGSASQWLAGWSAGAGLEYALAPRWSVKAEYLHYDLGSLSYNRTIVSSDTRASPPTLTLSAVGVSSSADFKGNIVRAGINYKLN